MISYNRLLSEIERYALKAKNAKNEQELREWLSAIRALCDVALNEKHPYTSNQESSLEGNHLLPSAKLDDEDANGDSIFDF